MPTDLEILGAAVGSDGAALLLPHLESVDAADGDVLMRDGEVSGRLYLLVSGALAIVHEAGGHRLDLGRCRPGAWIGEVGVIDGGPASATVLASGPCRLLRIDHARFEQIAHDRPEVASVLLRHVTRQLAERVAASSAGILHEIAPGQVVVKKPEVVRGWAQRALGWLLGGAP